MALDTERRAGADRRLATSSQTPPTGDGVIVLEVVLQRLDYMASISSLPPASVTSLREDLIARAEMGEKKYGTKLRVQNGRRAIVDFYQELQDALMYSMQARIEGDKETGQYFEILASISARVAVELNNRG